MTLTSILNLPPLPANGRSMECVTNMQVAYGPAYIQLVDANAAGWNPVQTLPFTLNEGVRRFAGYWDPGTLSLKEKDRARFWCFSVVFSYQPGVHEDSDSEEGIIKGVTPEWPGTSYPDHYSTIFLESIREAWASGFSPSAFNDPSQSSTLQKSLASILHGILAHELGHPPGRGSEGNDHKEAELMHIDGTVLSNFSAKTILRFRSATSWRQ